MRQKSAAMRSEQADAPAGNTPTRLSQVHWPFGDAQTRHRRQVTPARGGCTKPWTHLEEVGCKGRGSIASSGGAKAQRAAAIAEHPGGHLLRLRIVLGRPFRPGYPPTKERRHPICTAAFRGEKGPKSLSQPSADGQQRHLRWWLLGQQIPRRAQRKEAHVTPRIRKPLAGRHLPGKGLVNRHTTPPGCCTG